MPSLREVFDCPMGPNDAGVVTVGEYLLGLLALVWTEREGFDGKRPFGNSSWPYEIYIALGEAGYIDIELDEGGYVEKVDGAIADEMIGDLIVSLGPR